MEMVFQLITEKKHEGTLEDDTIFKKGLFAILELGESLDLVKKFGVSYLIRNPDLADHVAEEYIDAMFYILDAYGIFYRNKVFRRDPDEMFEYKWKKNMERPIGYGRPFGEASDLPPIDLSTKQGLVTGSKEGIIKKLNDPEVSLEEG